MGIEIGVARSAFVATVLVLVVFAVAASVVLAEGHVAQVVRNSTYDHIGRHVEPNGGQRLGVSDNGRSVNPPVAQLDRISGRPIRGDAGSQRSAQPVASTVPTIQRMRRVSRLATSVTHCGDLCREPRVEGGDLRPDLGKAGLEFDRR